MSFLSAEWRKLILVNYEIDPNVLKPYIPKGTELEYYNNTCYISLVGFMFKNTKLLGVRIPFHRNFEEVNLRFYVKYKSNNTWKRGVVFIKEIVPKPAITLVAKKVYKENYQTLPMKHFWKTDSQKKHIEYHWRTKNIWQKLSVSAEKAPLKILPNTETEFITEHYFGYTKQKNKTYEYEVKHPKWEHYLVNDFSTNVDFELNYGADFKHLTHQKPLSVILTEGSEISVENKIKIC